MKTNSLMIQGVLKFKINAAMDAILKENTKTKEHAVFWNRSNRTHAFFLAVVSVKHEGGKSLISEIEQGYKEEGER